MWYGAEMKFQNSFSSLPKIFFEEVQPSPLLQAKLAAVSKYCLRDMSIGLEDLAEEQLLAWLNGKTRLPGDQRISTRYAGHQFGHWAGQLGDGRAISLGEVINSKNQRWEIQTKGSGQTPFSRMGDGKAVIRSCVREFLCSEAMHALGIPTTRAVALVTGEDSVVRECIERSAMVVRAFPTQIRFGHFEYAFHMGEKQELQALVEYTQQMFFPEASNIPEMLESVVIYTADLIAQWMSVGFCHGVMNTDNMSILGLTLDYGPFGFLEDTHLDHICNHSDPQGRYAYDQQPGVALWNLDRLFICFSEIVDHSTLEKLLEKFEPRFFESWKRIFSQKFGLLEEDAKFISDGLRCLHFSHIDFTAFFRRLCDYEPHRLDLLQDLFPQGKVPDYFQDWLKAYDQKLISQGQLVAQRQSQMKRINPKYVLRNYIAQEIIAEVEADRPESLLQWLDVLMDPFSEHESFSSYALPTPTNKKNIEVSCSS